MNMADKINKLVRQALPKGKAARIFWRSTGFSDSQTLRVVTPAWKNLSRPQRIVKLEQAIAPSLNAKERARIFRISVLTPAEFKRLARIVPPQFLNGEIAPNGRRTATAT